MVKKENKTGFEWIGHHMPSLEIPNFNAGLKWRGADLQTMRNSIMGPAVSLEADFHQVQFDMGQGRSLAASLHPSPSSKTLPLVVIIHGLTGSEESPNVVSATAYFSSLGYPVLRLNLRGAGPSAETCAGPYHGGLTEDLAKVVEQLVGRDYGLGIVLYGISLGGNMMLKYLGETGEHSEIRAAIAISTPLCLKTVQVRLMEKRNRMYHNYLLLGMKTSAKALARHYDPDLIAKAQAAKSIYEYDDAFIAPIYGMSGAEEYYYRHSSGLFIPKITVPTLLIHAQNDPWIPIEDFYKQKWSDEGPISLVVTDDGGHAGFHSNDHAVPWHERVGALYLDHLFNKGKGDIS